MIISSIEWQCDIVSIMLLMAVFGQAPFYFEGSIFLYGTDHADKDFQLCNTILHKYQLLAPFISSLTVRSFHCCGRINIVLIIEPLVCVTE